MECVICHEDMNADVIKTECGHKFHAACIGTWFQRHTTCPTCRAVVAPAAPSEPQADPSWTSAWEDAWERHQAIGERLAAHRQQLTAIATRLESLKADVDAACEAIKAHEAAKAAKRSAAAKRAAATRAANRRALVVV